MTFTNGLRHRLSLWFFWNKRQQLKLIFGLGNRSMILLFYLEPSSYSRNPISKISMKFGRNQRHSGLHQVSNSLKLSLSLVFNVKGGNYQSSVLFSIIAFDNQENVYYSSRFKSPAGIDRDAIRFQGLEHLASISHDKPRHCAAVKKPSSTRKHRSNAPTRGLLWDLKSP